MLTGLAILGDTSLEFTSTTGNDENGAVGLGGTSNHVWGRAKRRETMSGQRLASKQQELRYKGCAIRLTLDEISVTWGVDDGDVVLGGLELPESNVDGDTTLTLGLQLVKNPCVLEGALAEFGGLLLELLDGSLVDTTALVDQVSGGGGLAGIDVADTTLGEVVGRV